MFPWKSKCSPGSQNVPDLAGSCNSGVKLCIKTLNTDTKYQKQ